MIVLRGSVWKGRAILLSYRFSLDSYFLVNIKIAERPARTCNVSYLLTNIMAKDSNIFIFLMCYTEAVLNHFALCFTSLKCPLDRHFSPNKDVSGGAAERESTARDEDKQDNKYKTQT